MMQKRCLFTLASARAGRRQSGLTLIEVLVAMVVLAIRLLGMAGLQLRGIQVNQGSTYRWQAAALASDMADRMRADRPNVGSFAFANCAAPPAAVTPAGAAVAEWLARVAALPGGCANIQTAAGAGTTSVTITVTWDDTRAANSKVAVTGTYALATEM
jgi:type IV pilus assembly protein PilV